MAKIEIELVKRILKRSTLDEKTVAVIVDELQSAVKEENTEDEPKMAPIKKQHVVLIADNEGELLEKEWVGWVLQLPEDESPQVVAERILKVSKAFNLTQKGRKFPVETIGETCENVPARIFKEQKLWLKTKEPVLVVPIQNSLTECSD